MAGAQHAAELASPRCVDPSGQIHPFPPPTLVPNPSPVARVWGAASSPPPARVQRSSTSPTMAPRAAAPAGRCFSTTRQRQRWAFSTTMQRQPAPRQFIGFAEFALCRKESAQKSFGGVRISPRIWDFVRVYCTSKALGIPGRLGK